jgi:exodeoxyribonuclease VII small subunit
LSENGDPGRVRGPRAEGEGGAMPDEATSKECRDRRQAEPRPTVGTEVEAEGKEKEEALGFRQAMEELEGILQRIEGEEIDIDQLAQELRRAAQLLDLCRGKIRKAEVEVTQIVQSLEESGEDDDRERS